MSTPDDGGHTARTLQEHIEELESLLGRQKSATAPDGAGAEIPILDELVDVSDMPAGPATADSPTPMEPRQLLELARRLDARLAGELGDLAEVIRDVVRRCIHEELRTHLSPAGPGNAQTGSRPAAAGAPKEDE